MVRDLKAGLSATVISVALNAEAEPSPRDYWALKNNRRTGGKTGGTKGEGVVRKRFKWTPSIIKRLLTSPALVGWKMHGGNPVRDSEGRPVMLTNEPVLTRTEFDIIGELLAERTTDNRERVDSDALLLRVIRCESCGGRMYLNRQSRGGKPQSPTYNCNALARGETCAAPAYVKAEWVDEYVQREFLRLSRYHQCRDRAHHSRIRSGAGDCGDAGGVRGAPEAGGAAEVECGESGVAEARGRA